MNISCCIWALSAPEEIALNRLAELGFAHVDVQALTYTNPPSRAQIDALGIAVCCVGLSFNMPAEAALDSPDRSVRQRALDHLARGLEQAASYGANCAYVVPGEHPDGLDYFGQSMLAAADLAASHNIALGIEHFPGKALPTAVDTLAYLRALDHVNLYLLLDSGHLQISQEDPTSVIAQAGDRLCYVHLDDNDGQQDLHWGLCEGVMTRSALSNLLDALQDSPYQGPISLELHPQLPDPEAALASSLHLLRDIRGVLR